MVTGEARLGNLTSIYSRVGSWLTRKRVRAWAHWETRESVAKSRSWESAVFGGSNCELIGHLRTLDSCLLKTFQLKKEGSLVPKSIQAYNNCASNHFFILKFYIFLFLTISEPT